MRQELNTLLEDIKCVRREAKEWLSHKLIKILVLYKAVLCSSLSYIFKVGFFPPPPIFCCQSKLLESHHCFDTDQIVKAGEEEAVTCKVRTMTQARKNAIVCEAPFYTARSIRARCASPSV